MESALLRHRGNLSSPIGDENANCGHSSGIIWDERPPALPAHPSIALSVLTLNRPPRVRHRIAQPNSAPEEKTVSLGERQGRNVTNAYRVMAQGHRHHDRQRLDLIEVSSRQIFL